MPTETHDKQAVEGTNLYLSESVALRRMVALLNAFENAVALITDDSMIETTNLAFDMAFGYERGELSGHPINRIIESSSMEVVSAALASVIWNFQPQRLITFGQAKNGSVLRLEIRFSSIDGDKRYLLCSVHIPQQYQPLNEVLDYLAGISHDLRNPLATIFLNSYSLEKNLNLTVEQRVEKAREIGRHAHIISKLIDFMLDMARLNEQPFKSFPEIDLCHLLTEIASEQKTFAESKDQELVLSIPQSVITAKIDPIEFESVWRNLIDNAIKYTPEHGIITLHLDTYRSMSNSAGKLIFVGLNNVIEIPKHRIVKGCYLVGQVKDTGRGMDDDELVHLFERFYRGWATQTDIPGTGLGLAHVRQILQKQGGDIFVTSIKHEGSVFTFWLPLDTKRNGIQ